MSEPPAFIRDRVREKLGSEPPLFIRQGVQELLGSLSKMFIQPVAFGIVSQSLDAPFTRVTRLMQLQVGILSHPPPSYQRLTPPALPLLTTTDKISLARIPRMHTRGFPRVGDTRTRSIASSASTKSKASAASGAAILSRFSLPFPPPLSESLSQRARRGRSSTAATSPSIPPLPFPTSLPPSPLQPRPGL